MPRGNYEPNRDLLNLLSTFEGGEYFVKDVRNKFQESYRAQSDPAELRRWIYGQFRTLVKHGYITCIEKKDSTNSFRNTGKLLSETNEGNKTTGNELRSDVVPDLKKRMNKLKLELMHCDGEVKEFEELNELFPELSSTIKLVYSNVKARHVELVGRVNAVESLITRISNPI